MVVLTGSRRVVDLVRTVQLASALLRFFNVPETFGFASEEATFPFLNVEKRRFNRGKNISAVGKKDHLHISVSSVLT